MNRRHRQHSSSDAAETDGSMSFIDTIRQMLESRDRLGNGCADAAAAERCESKDLPSETLLAMLGQAGWGVLDSAVDGKGQPSADAAGANFLVRVNQRLAELKAALGGASGDTALVDADVIALLNGKMPAFAELAAAIQDSAPNDFEKTVSLLQTAIGQQADQPQIQSAGDIGDHPNNGAGDAASSREGLADSAKLPAQLQALLDGIATDRTGDSEADDPAQADGSGKIPIRVERVDASTRTDGMDDRAGRRDNMLQAATPDSIQTKSGQEPDKPSPVQQSGPGKNAQRDSTLMGQSQTAASPTKDEKKPLRHTGQHQTVEQAQATSSPAESEKTETRNNASMRFALSADSGIADRAPATSTAARSASMSPAGDAAFHKTVMDQIVEKASLRSANDRSEMRIHLKPDTLGDVRMSIVAEKNQMVVQMVADKSETKEIIESQLHHLKAELDRQGITVGKIEVTINTGNDQQGSREQFFQMFKEHTGGGKKDHRESQRKQSPAHQHRDESEPAASVDGINYFV